MVYGLWFCYAYILSAWVGGIERDRLWGHYYFVEISLEHECLNQKTASGFHRVELETINGLWFCYAYILSAWVGGIKRDRLLKVLSC